ncbi:hypothetical protein C0075_25985, partial [Rhizobium sp. KAs_5_22]
MAGSFPATRAVRKLVDALKNEGKSAPPLLECLLSEAQDRPLLTAAEQLKASADHLGQMEC